MHDVIPMLSAQDRERSLGWLAVWWIETFTVIGRGDATGRRIRHTPEYFRFIVDCYALDKHGRRRFGHVFLSRPKGCNKSGFAAELALFEAFGPCRFAGWAKGGETYTFLGCTYTYRKGEPMGRPIQSPLVTCLATAEEQTGEIYDTVYYNCTEGPLSLLAGRGMDAGTTRIKLPQGGKIVYSGSSARSSDGGLQTFICFDETHQYNNKRLRDTYDIMTQNLTKRGVEADPWFLETTTMYCPGENSVAEQTYKTARDLESGKLLTVGADKAGNTYTKHPITGTDIIGFTIPYWEEAKKMCLDAAQKVPQMRFVAWDVAITPNGPTFIEGNSFPSHAVPQFAAHYPDGIGILPEFRKFIDV